VLKNNFPIFQPEIKILEGAAKILTTPLNTRVRLERTVFRSAKKLVLKFLTPNKGRYQFAAPAVVKLSERPYIVLYL
jgi:hypothetical protein